MAEYDHVKKKLNLKFVYYGPALSGKTTNLTCLHDQLRPQQSGQMMILETKNDRTLFFDLLPVGMMAPSGLLIKVKLFTVPGQVAHDSTRKAVLSRADGVVFVADSQRNQVTNNAQSFENLADNATKVGLDFDRLPLVVQFNKRDLPEVQPEQDILQRWQQTQWTVLFASAARGDGIKETFSALLSSVYRQIDEKYELSKKHGVTFDAFESGLCSGSTDRKLHG